MRVMLNIEIGTIPIDEPRHRIFAEHLIELVGENEAELGIVIVDDQEIQCLNRDYRGVDKATDVLTFSLREGEPVGQNHVLGDIVISAETAKRQSLAYEHSLGDEIDELIFHGFLHVLGYDHDNEENNQWFGIETTLREKLERKGVTYVPDGLMVKADNGENQEGRAD